MFMKTYLITLLLVLFPALSFSQSNTIEEFFEKLYLRTFKNDEHVLKFITEGVEMDGQLQYTGTKIFVMQGSNTTLTAIQSSNNTRETFTVNLDSGTVALKKANLVLYDKTDYSLAEDADLSQESQEFSIETQNGEQINKTQTSSMQNSDLGISFDIPIGFEEDNHTEQPQPVITNEITANDKRNETSRYVNALAICQKNLREMDKIIAIYDTCGAQSLLMRYDSIAQVNQSLLDDIDKDIVIYNQRLQKSENDYLSKYAHLQAKHDSIVNFLPEMVDADGFSFLVNKKEKEVILYHPIDKSLSTYQVPSTITYRIHTLKVVGIGSYAFENLAQLTEVKMPSSILEIRDKAFIGCSNLKNIQLSDHLQVIGKEVFKGCQSLQSITLPSSLTNIEESAFSQCTGLKEVVAKMTNPIQLGDDAFDTTKNNNTLLVLPNGCFDKYLKSPWASCFYQIREQFTESIPSAHLLTDSHTFLIKSNGTADFLNFPIKPYQDAFTVPEKIFNNSYTVTGIGDNAFYNQEYLKSVVLPNTIVAIGDSAFAFCKSLTQIQLPNSLKTIGEKAFLDCKKLQSIDFPAGLKTIKNSAFAYCSSLDTMLFPNGLTTINDKVCQNCLHLKSINIPSSIEVIGEYAFQNCKELQTITLHFGTSEINQGAFSGCQGLIVIELPSSIRRLGENCFEGCDDISAVYCQGQTPPEYAINSFSPNVIDAILYVPEKADKDYETRGYESFFDKIKTLPNEEKLERHKAKSLADGLEDVSKKPRLREKRSQKEARQK